MRTSQELLLADVNVLLALAWPNHQFHRLATTRFQDRAQQWATCALTELAFIRLSSNPATGLGAKRPAEAAALLAAMTSDPAHEHLSAMPSSASEGFDHVWSLLAGHQQVMDAYLVCLARHHKATLLTFDFRIAALAQEGCVEILYPGVEPS
ncbi:MAG: TA system VapC family ribonuclease toxin [Acidobacteriota bacterium]